MTGRSQRSYWSALALTGMLTLTLGLALASPATADNEEKFYQQHNLVSDVPGLADHTDPNLVNAWGMSFSSTSPFWVSDNGTGVSTLYNGAGQSFPVASPLVVTIPLPPGSTEPHSKPTGQVFNGTSDFQVASGLPSVFIFATEDGTIAGWNPFVPVFLSTTAILKVDNSGSGAIYKGLETANIGPHNFLYAANFHAGTIDVFDKNFNPVPLPPGAFSDPNLPAGYAPFNIQNLGGQLYVAYAKQDADKEDEVAGQGKGFVDVFNSNGVLVQRVATRGKLNAPWGLALAPPNFGRFSNDVLVGNFGDGRISAYRLKNNRFQFHGQLNTPDGKRVEIDGLWALSFGKGGANNGPTNVLFFTAGPDDEDHGLFGSLTACSKSTCGNP
ncbi:MAG: TIGR03118 family protein [Deltaproteobacteria bacterium]|nr:TIGR03118 family protein [Deltaproteobacteria bacterium]